MTLRSGKELDLEDAADVTARVAVLQHAPHVAEEGGALLRVEVAEGRAEEGDEPAAAARDVLELALEVPDDALHLQPGMSDGQGVGRRRRTGRGDLRPLLEVEARLTGLDRPRRASAREGPSFQNGQAPRTSSDATRRTA